MPYFDYVEFIGFAFPLLIIICVGYYLPSIIKNRTLSAESHAEDRFSEHLRLLDISVETNSHPNRGNALVLGGKMQRPSAPKQRENANFQVAKQQYLLRRQQLQKQAKYRLIALFIALGLIAVSSGLVIASILTWPWIAAAVGATVVCLVQSSYAGAMARTELSDLRAQLRDMEASLPAGRSVSETEKRVKELKQARLSVVEEAAPMEAAHQEAVVDQVIAPANEVGSLSETAEKVGDREETAVIVESYEISNTVAELQYQKATFTPAQLVLDEENHSGNTAESATISGKQVLDEFVQRHESAKMIEATSEYVRNLPATEEVLLVHAEASPETTAPKAAVEATVKTAKASENAAGWTPMRVPTPVYALKKMAPRRHVDAKELLQAHLGESAARVPYRPKNISTSSKETVSTNELVAQEVTSASLANVDSILEQRRAVGS